MKKRGVAPALELARLSPKLTLGVVWSLIFIGSFLWKALDTPSPIPDAVDWDGHAADLAKPAYCREDMPGGVD